MAIVYDKPIEDFWDWWTAAGRAAAEAGMRDCAFDAFDREMNARVEAMHADLAWELMPGGQAEHALVVTAAGVPDGAGSPSAGSGTPPRPTRPGNTIRPVRPAFLRRWS